MIVRFASPQDKQHILNLFTQLGILINKKLGYHDLKNENAYVYGSKNFDQVMGSETIKIFILEDREKVIGAASFFIFTDMISGETFAHIDDFIIDEKEQGKGYGKALMYGILKYAKKHKINPVKLTSSLEFQEAHQFYEKIGGTFSQKVIKF
jgi:GNAT superfamily N-acetyltransferase